MDAGLLHVAIIQQRKKQQNTYPIFFWRSL